MLSTVHCSRRNDTSESDTVNASMEDTRIVTGVSNTHITNSELLPITEETI